MERRYNALKKTYKRTMGEIVKLEMYNSPLASPRLSSTLFPSELSVDAAMPSRDETLVDFTISESSSSDGSH
jgi:hypothetical protein